MNNIIPALNAQGSFECIEPFESLCDRDLYYTVEAIRTIDELRKAKINVDNFVNGQIGKQGTPEGDKIIKDVEVVRGAVVTLIAQSGEMIHIPSTHFKSFPLVDGVKYERLCLFVDLGSVPPTLKEGINELKVVIKEYVTTHVGIKDPNVNIGTIPLRGYVDKARAELFELQRQDTISNNTTNVARIKELEDLHREDRAYIADLEARLLLKK